MLNELKRMLEDRPMKFSEILELFNINKKRALKELEFLNQKLKKENKVLLIKPAKCKKCGYKFKGLKAPSKCPKCGSEWIEEPIFYINKI